MDRLADSLDDEVIDETPIGGDGLGPDPRSPADQVVPINIWDQTTRLPRVESPRAGSKKVPYA